MNQICDSLNQLRMEFDLTQPLGFWHAIYMSVHAVHLPHLCFRCSRVMRANFCRSTTRRQRTSTTTSRCRSVIGRTSIKQMACTKARQRALPISNDRAMEEMVLKVTHKHPAEGASQTIDQHQKCQFGSERRVFITV